MSIDVFAQSIITSGNIPINQDCTAAWYYQLKEHQAEMKYQVKEQCVEA